MLSMTIPKIFFKSWFWLPTAVGLIVIACIAGRKGPPAFPRVGKFLAKHKRAIEKITEIFLICVVLLWSSLPLYGVRGVFSALSTPEPIRKISVQTAWMTLFIFLTVWSGWSGLLVGLLSVFQSNLTKTKRIILLIVCLLPIAFTVLQVLTGITENTWLIVQLCLRCSAGSWIVNAPAIFIGKHFFLVSWNIMRKLHFVSGDYPA